MVEPMDHAEAIRKLSDLLERMKQRANATNISVIVTFSDGDIGTFFEGTDYVHLLGAIDVLHSRVLNMFESR